MTRFLHTYHNPTLTTLICLFFGILTGYAQTNILSNSNFETYSACPTGLSQATKLTDWSLGSASPEYFNCGYNGNGVINGNASNGTGVLGIWGGPNHPSCSGAAYSESLVGTLTTQMVAGTSYQVTFDIQVDGTGTATNGPNNCVDVGFYFYDQTSPPNLSGFCCKPVTPQVAVSGGAVLSGTYQRMTATFTATGTFDRVLVGTYCNANTAGSACSDYLGKRVYFNLDNIEVVESLVLPVEWERFEGEAMTDKNRLTWSISSETDNDHFIVEKCEGNCNGADSFLPIGQVDAEGIGYEGQSYKFDDVAPAGGKSYYRIRQVNVNGNESLSRIVELSRDEAIEVEVYPNPFEGQVAVGIAGNPVSDIQLTLTDLSGRLLMQHRYPKGYGKQEILISTENIASGVYFLAVAMDTETTQSYVKTIKVMKK